MVEPSDYAMVEPYDYAMVEPSDYAMAQEYLMWTIVIRRTTETLARGAFIVCIKVPIIQLLRVSNYLRLPTSAPVRYKTSVGYL